MVEVRQHTASLSPLLEARFQRESYGMAQERKTGVLVVDDDSVVVSLLKTALELHGFAVWASASGPESIELYREHADRIDLALVEARMVVLDGPQTLRALRAHNPHVQVCFMTADPLQCHSGGLVELGAVRIIRKPFRLIDLLQTVRDLTKKIPKLV